MTGQGISEWSSYEDVAVYLLNEVASVLDLERVEGKQYVVGVRSGMRWEIEGKGVKVDGEGFVIVECRRYTKSKQKPEQMGGLAYRIIDTGAEGAIIISPLGLQVGAAKIAAAENIQTVYMDKNSTRTDYLFRFLSQVFVGVSDSADVTDEAKIEVIKSADD